jgi:pulmonary surfactant-associated protein D
MGASGVRADPGSGLCAAAFEQSATWADAEALCVGLGGHLATIVDAQANLIVGQAANDVSCTWTWMGLTDVGSEGVWTWSSGPTATFFDWWTNEPNGGTNENCAVIHGSLQQWGDAPCDGTRPYVCSF